MYRTTLTDGHGVTHAVTMPDIPADYPSGGTVIPIADCGAGGRNGLPAHLARQTRHPSFTGRQVTCHTCRTGGN